MIIVLTFIFICLIKQSICYNYLSNFILYAIALFLKDKIPRVKYFFICFLIIYFNNYLQRT